VAAVVLRAHEAVKLVVVQVHQSFLELRALSLQPFRETVTDFINLGVGELDCLGVRHLYVASVLILAD